MALQGAGGSLSPTFHTPQCKGCCFEHPLGLGGTMVWCCEGVLSEHGYMLSTDIWAELSRLTSPQDSSSDIPLSNIVLLCGFLYLFFPSAWAS